MEVEAQNVTTKSKPSESSHEITQWLGNWIWRSVQCLIESPEFNPSPKWAAQKLNVSVDKIVEAFEGLTTLGMIKREDNTYKVNSNWYQVTPIETTRENLLESHTRLAPQILSQLTPADKFTVQFFRGNQELLNKYAPKFMQLFNEMNKEAEANGLTDVIASEISFAILTNKISQNGGVQ
ncbi:MAG: DUF4423 domain-containing protein [Pseudobdellovibrio sp.]